MGSLGRPSRFSPEVRARAVRMVEEHREAHASEWAVLQSVAPKLGCTAETLRQWVRQVQRDAGHRPGLTTSERERLKELEREVRELKRANESPAESVRVFRPGGARPPEDVATMVQFIADHRAVVGVEPICAGLPIAPSTYHLIAIGTSGHIRRAGPHGRSATISSASRFSGSMTRTSRSTAPRKSGSSGGGTASAWRAAPWRA